MKYFAPLLLPLFLTLILVSPAMADLVVRLRVDLTGSVDAVGDDRGLPTDWGTSEETYALQETVDDNWNTDVYSDGVVRSGLWDCYVKLRVQTGSGPPNRVELYIDRINSSGVIQENILTEETGTLNQGVDVLYPCTGTTASITFGAGDAVMFTAIRSNGNQDINLKYNDDPPSNSDSWVIIPPEAVSENQLMIITN